MKCPNCEFQELRGDFDRVNMMNEVCQRVDGRNHNIMLVFICPKCGVLFTEV